MRIELDLSQAAEWAAALPTWAWVSLAVHGWYMLAGLVIKRMGKGGYGAGQYFDEPSSKFFAWAFSPILVTTIGIFWPMLSLSSGFLIKPPWSVRWRYAPDWQPGSGDAYTGC